MAHSRSFDRSVRDMEWGDVLYTLQSVIGQMLRETPRAVPSSEPLPPGVDSYPQPVEGLNGGYTACYPQGAAPPHSFVQPSPWMADQGPSASPLRYQELLCDPDIMQSDHMNHQAGCYRWEQGAAPPHSFVQPSPWMADQGPSASPLRYQELLCDPDIMQSDHMNHQAGCYRWEQHKDTSVVRLHKATTQNLPPAGALYRNRDLAYRVEADVSAPSVSACPPPKLLRKRLTNKKQQVKDRPYVKKPPNAFMLFMRERRPSVMAELNITESAVINTTLGKRWKLLSEEEQAKYYEEADTLKQIHSEQHPDWTSRENYGKRMKRERSSKRGSYNKALQPEAETRQAKRMRVTPVQTQSEPFTKQTVLTRPPHERKTVTLPVCEICHLPQVYRPNWQNSPTAASPAQQLSPAAPTETHTAEYYQPMMEQLQPSSYQLPSSPDTDTCSIDSDDVNC